MKNLARKLLNSMTRRLIKVLPRKYRFALHRSFFKCNQALPDNLTLKIAETQQEIEACLALLHDAYVDSGFMKPHPSGLRATIFHALPTTTTLCAKIGDRVVGTISLIRDGPYGFPLQKIFDLQKVRLKNEAIAEVSALAVHRSYRRLGGLILFPLMKFMYEYCTTYFDVRHLVIAVNPRHIEMYESLLLFRRLKAQPVENYDFVNGAPAIGATLDLYEALGIYKKVYGSRSPERNLFHYFVQLRLPNIQMPARRFYTTNDPVMTPELLDYFFNVRVQCFKELDDRDRARLHMIYDLPAYYPILPDFSERAYEAPLRHHARFSYKCPGRFSCTHTDAARVDIPFEMVELSRTSFVAHVSSKTALRPGTRGEIEIRLGQNEISHSTTLVTRDLGQGFFAFRLETPDLIWRKFSAAVSKGSTKRDMDIATQFLSSQIPLLS